MRTSREKRTGAEAGLPCHVQCAILLHFLIGCNGTVHMRRCCNAVELYMNEYELRSGGYDTLRWIMNTYAAKRCGFVKRSTERGYWEITEDGIEFYKRNWQWYQEQFLN